MKIFKKSCALSRLFSMNSPFSALVHFVCFLSLLFVSACSELEKPKPEPFYAQTAPPQKKEFRWSNGKMPKTLDPAKASAPPETDIVRAIFEGLTETDSKTLKAVPAIAAEWTASEDFKTWTFKLRRDAKWSNGKPITAEDFVRSWKRLAEMSEKKSHEDLLRNISGMPFKNESDDSNLPEMDSEMFLGELSRGRSPFLYNQPNSNASTLPKPEQKQAESLNKTVKETERAAKKEKEPEVKFGVEAVGEHVLKVSLIKPDKDFPSLVAHPIFRPVYGEGKEFETENLNAGIVTSGAFRIVSIGQDGITLDRSEHYWNNGKIELERVRFVPTENAEKALAAYRAGEIDAVTNVTFEPLALKLLTPYDDFRRTTHSALNFYEFNSKNAPFSDRRVREALAIAIERERLTEGDMEGATEPALGFLPFTGEPQKKLVQNIEKARQLLSEAGFSEGENFPVVRLVVNRNDVQQKIARSVAKMWKQNLNVETEIIVKEPEALAEIKKNGEFDVIRRGVVLPTTDETANMMAIFEPTKKVIQQTENVEQKPEENAAESDKNAATENAGEEKAANEKRAQEDLLIETLEIEGGSIILTEAEAIGELLAIPLYFPTSYSLVKPYIQGFEINTLDAPSLKDVRIDNNWQPKEKKNES